MRKKFTSVLVKIINVFGSFEKIIKIYVPFKGGGGVGDKQIRKIDFFFSTFS